MSRLNTLLLDISEWDLVLDAYGNIAVAQPPYALAQDVASAVQTWQGECIYDTTQGIPWDDEVIGQLPPQALLTGLMSKEATTRVPGVVQAQTLIQSFKDRLVTGQLQFIDEEGVMNGVTF